MVCACFRLETVLKVYRTAKIRSVKACFDNAAKPRIARTSAASLPNRAAKANFSTPLLR